MALDDLMFAYMGVKPQFRDLVVKTMGSLSLRQGYIRTGIDTDTLSRMKQGDVPRLDKLIAFARGFALDVNEVFLAAGEEPIAVSPTACSYMLIERMREEPEQVREAVSLIVAEARAVYEAPPASQPAPTGEPDFTIPDRMPSPQDSPYLSWFADRAREWYHRDGKRFAIIPPLFAAQLRTGYIFKTETVAYEEFLAWLDRVAKANPREDAPDELLAARAKDRSHPPTDPPR